MEEIELKYIQSRERISVNNPEVEHMVKQITYRILTDYCKNTTIHGCKYFTERQRHWTERSLWVIVFIVLTCFCGTYIIKNWLEWNSSPAIMSLSGEETLISEIPFPTVTVCPEIKATKHYLNESFGSYEEGMQMVKVGNGSNSSGMSTQYLAVQHLCSKTLPEYFTDEYADESIFKVIENMAPHDVEGSSQWNFGWDDSNVSRMSFNRHMKPILTEEGVFFTFNALNSRDIYTDQMAPGMMTYSLAPNITYWNPDYGYDNSRSGRKYPLRTYLAGHEGALWVQLIIKDEDRGYSCLSDHFSGYNVFLHPPGEAIRFSSLLFHVPSLEEASISIKPKLTNTSEGLRQYRPEQRRCLYNSESKLTFFKIYSQKNCESECVASYVLNKCGCVKFSMPRNDTTKICGTAKIDCYGRNEIVLFGGGAEFTDIDPDAALHRKKCNCLPACFAVSYYADIDRKNVNIPMPKWFGNTQISFKSHTTLLTIFFRDQNLERVIRKERGTLTEYLSICGGLVSLFMGVSALSIVEIIYYATIRLFWSCRLWKCDRTEDIPVATTPPELSFGSISIEIPYSE